MKHRIIMFIVLLFIALVSTSPTWAQAPTKKVYLPVIIAHVEATQFAMPTVKQISATNYEMKLTGDDGSAYTINIAKDSTEFYPQKVHYTPAPDDGLPAATATISPDGSRMEVQVDGSSLLWIVQSNGQTVTLTLKDGTQETEVVSFPLEQSRQSVLFPQQTTSTCTNSRNFCKNFRNTQKVSEYIDKAAGVFALVGTVIPPFEVGAGVLGLIGKFSKLIDMSCVLFFADDKEALDYTEGLAAQEFLDIEPGAFQGKYLKHSPSFAKKLPETAIGQLISKNVNKEKAITELFGRASDWLKLEEKLVELASPINKQLVSTTNNQAMFNLRKALGIGWCDIDEYSVTCNGAESCDIPAGSSANIKISYKFYPPYPPVKAVDIFLGCLVYPTTRSDNSTN